MKRRYGRPLADGYTQDGELLNFLGSHLRKINRTALTDDFEKRFSNELKTLQFTCSGSSLVVCDDMRPAEAEYMQSRTFALLRLETPTTICAERRRARGDITLGAVDGVHCRHIHSSKQMCVL
jgi:cytidine deaminase